jgi:hypothetical protein
MVLFQESGFPASGGGQRLRDFDRAQQAPGNQFAAGHMAGPSSARAGGRTPPPARSSPSGRAGAARSGNARHPRPSVIARVPRQQHIHRQQAGQALGFVHRRQRSSVTQSPTPKSPVPHGAATTGARRIPGPRRCPRPACGCRCPCCTHIQVQHSGLLRQQRRRQRGSSRRAPRALHLDAGARIFVQGLPSFLSALYIGGTWRIGAAKRGAAPAPHRRRHLHRAGARSTSPSASPVLVVTPSRATAS